MIQNDHETKVRKLDERKNKAKSFVLGKIEEIGAAIKAGTATKSDIQWLRRVQKRAEEFRSKHA